MPAGDIPQRERRCVFSFLVEHAEFYNVSQLYNAKKSRVRRKRERDEELNAPNTPAVTPNPVENEQKDTKTNRKKSASATAPNDDAPAPPLSPTLTLVTAVGRELKIPFVSSATVGDVKNDTEHRHGIPANKQRLFFSEREFVDDSQLLTDANVCDGAMLLIFGGL